ncbi:Cyclic di-GMP phosphodiesterase CdpA [bacterium HR15]|nr:Cyclic di-GMP phosphodiesterase CdpA [bacterium HR15]
MITVRQYRWGEALPVSESGAAEGRELLLVFGPTEQLSQPEVHQVLKAWAQARLVVGASSDVTITSEGVDDRLVFTHLRFEHTTVRMVSVPVSTLEASYEAGVALGRALANPELTYVLLLADGLCVNGSALVRGVQNTVGAGVPITGGLANDGARFQQTLIVAGDQLLSGAVVAVGFYGPRFRIGHGAVGGWKPFGPLMRITRSQGSIVYEFDGQPALALYERYLGKDAERLPASGLLFPLALYNDHQQPVGLIRTLLNVDRAQNALIFAGDVPEGSWGRLMHARFDDLVDGAEHSAHYALQGLHAEQPPFALLISCIGRKFVMGDFVAEEVEGVRRLLGESTVLTGFYSNGEISPFSPTARCELHNQTMTITLWVEQ